MLFSKRPKSQVNATVPIEDLKVGEYFKVHGVGFRCTEAPSPSTVEGETHVRGRKWGLSHHISEKTGTKVEVAR